MNKKYYISIVTLFILSSGLGLGANVYWTAGSSSAEGGIGVWDTTTPNWSLDSSATYTTTTWPGAGNVANIRNSSDDQVTTLTLGSAINVDTFVFATVSSNTNGTITIDPGTGFSINATPTNSSLVFLSGTLGSSNTIHFNVDMDITDYSTTSATTFKVFGSSWGGDLSIAGDLNVTGSSSGAKSLIFDVGSGSGTMTYSGSTTDAPGGTATLAMQFGSSGATGVGVYNLSGNNTAVTAESRIWNGTVVLNSDNALGSAKAVLGGGGSGVDAKLVTGTSGLTIGNEVAMGSATTINTVGGEHTSGVSTFTGNVSFSASDLVLTSASGGVVDFNGNLFSSSSTSITKSGDGVVRVNRSSGVSYNGTTSIEAGSLIVNNDSGNGLGAGVVTVGTNTATLASLGGTGTITSDVVLAGGGSISPGDINTGTLASTIGTFTVGSVTWNSDDTSAGMFFNLGADTASSDQLVISGSFTQSSGSSYLFGLNDEGLTIGGTYTLITFGSTNYADANSFGLDEATIAMGIDGTFSFDGNSLEFMVTAIPEPSGSAWLAGIATALVLYLSKRKKNV